MRWEWTDRNPARSAKPPTLNRKTILATSPEAVAKVIAAAGARSAALGLYLWLVVVTGVRRGELCGLQIRDIDLDRGLAHVAFNYVVRAGQRIRKDTKTHQDRWLAIDPVTCALIESYLAEIKAELAALGVELRDDAYLFSNDPAHARPWNPDWVSHRVADAADAAGVKLDIKGGRHYTASQLLAGGSTCETLPHGSATAAAARPRCGTTPTRSPRWRGTGGPGSARGPVSRAGPGPGSRPARVGRPLARRRSARSDRAHASAAAILARSSGRGMWSERGRALAQERDGVPAAAETPVTCRAAGAASVGREAGAGTAAVAGRGTCQPGSTISYVAQPRDTIRHAP